MEKSHKTASPPSEDHIKYGVKIDKSVGDKLSRFIANMFGSLTFLCICLVFFLVWIVWNLGLVPGLQPYDPFPFPALEMAVSLFAVILSVSVLISQNRQRRWEKIREHVEFEVNVNAEKEITKVLEMLHEIQKKMGIDKADDELEDMKERLDLQKLQRENEE